jgi:class 3 adenylate cyclase
MFYYFLPVTIWFNPFVPSENTEQRKLAAIMFTDMVGYSALSQRVESSERADDSRRRGSRRRTVSGE